DRRLRIEANEQRRKVEGIPPDSRGAVRDRVGTTGQIAAGPDERVASQPTRQGIGALTTGHPVESAAANKDIVAAESKKDVVAGTSCKRVDARAACQGLTGIGWRGDGELEVVEHRRGQ